MCACVCSCAVVTVLMSEFVCVCACVRGRWGLGEKWDDEKDWGGRRGLHNRFAVCRPLFAVTRHRLGLAPRGGQ